MRSITIALTGQALIHGPVATPDRQVLQVFGSADAAGANLEATAECEGAWPTKAKTLHLASADGICSLRDLGLSILTHANNHAFDLGPPGIRRTREVAEAAGLRLAGSGANRAEAAATAVVGEPGRHIAFLSADFGPQPDIVYAGDERAGINPLRLVRRVTVGAEDFTRLRRLAAELGDEAREAARATVGYRARKLPDDALELFGTEIRIGSRASSRFEAQPDDLAALAAAIERAKHQAALVAIALHGHHWDGDWTRTPHWLLDVARQLIDSGADLVFGTGAPVLQPIAFHRGRPILAGLGNVVFHTRRADVYDRQGVPVWTGAAIRCAFDPASRLCIAVGIMPLAVGRPREGADALAPPPAPLVGAEAERVFAFLTKDLDDEERRLVSRL